MSQRLESRHHHLWLRSAERGSAAPALEACADADALEHTAPAWDELASSLPSPMQQRAWVRAALELPGLRLQAFSLEDGSAVAPLEARQGRLESATVSRLYEPVDLLWSSDEALGRLADELARLGRPLLLRRVPADSPSLAALEAAFGRRALVAVRHSPALPVLDLVRGQDPEALLNSGRRSDLRRARRLAARGGEVETEFLSPSPANVRDVLSVALGVEVRSWKGRSGTALAQDRVRLPFYTRYALEQAEAGSLRVAFLRIAGRPVAMQIAVERAQRLWLLKIGYDEAYARCSPGQLLLLEVARRSVGDDLEAVEFLGSEAPWTRAWTRRERPCVAAAFYPRRARSAWPLACDASRLVGRKLATRSP